jgi:hypothetical protein
MAVMVARATADLHVHREERNQNGARTNGLASAAGHRLPLAGRRGGEVGIHTGTMPSLGTQWQGTGLPKSV